MRARPKTIASSQRKSRPTPPSASPSRVAALLGNLDLVDPDGVVEGWCWSPDEPQTRRVIAVLIDGVEAATAICDEQRPDLAKAGIGDGSHAFLLVLPPDLRKPGMTASVSLREVATGQAVGSAVTITWRPDRDSPDAAASTPLPALQGHVDGVTKDGRISGWCWWPGDPTSHVRLQIIVDDEVVGLASAINYRPDLEQAGIGDGTFGFSFALPWSVLASKGTLSIRVRDEASGTPLGVPILLRLGRLSEAEDRVFELERQIRLMRAQIGELSRELDARADEQPLANMFATRGAMFGELSRAPTSLAAPQALLRWQADGAAATTDPALLLRQAIETLKTRHTPFDLAIPEHPIATIVIPARATTATLHRCLRALRAAGVDRLADIVLVDDGDPTGFGHDAALMPSIVRNVHLLHAQGGGLAAGLNELVPTARGTLFGFIDPELMVATGWLDEIAETFAREPAAGLIGGKLVDADGLLRHAGLIIGDSFRPEAFGAYGNASLPDVSFLREVDGVAALGFVVRRDALAEAGLFPAGYVEAGPMVLDLCLRLRASGRSVLYQARALATCEDAIDLTPRVADLSRACDDSDRLRHIWFNDDLASARLRPVRFVGHALVIDNDLPRPDRDSGSIAALEQMQVLRRLGYRVTFAAASGPIATGSFGEKLEGLGIELVRAPHYSSISDYLAQNGADLAIVQIYRYMNATMFLERVRELAPRAKLIFSPADLHHLREMRHATISGLQGNEAGLMETRDQELHCVRHADATILNSDFEYGLLKAEVEHCNLKLLRWITRPSPSPRGFAERSGICFVGNYHHGPNVDGVRWFTHAVMPLLRAQRAGIVLHIVGSEMTDEVRALAGPDVVVHGWVEDLAELLSRMRLSVAPLRFGAGFKGKVATSLAHGVPVVGTAIAMEGTGLESGDGIVLADSAAQFATEVLRLHADAKEWNTQSDRALERCRSLYSPEAALGVYRGLLSELGLPVLAA